MKPWQGSQQEVPESHEAEPKEETENMIAVKDTTPKRKKETELKRHDRNVKMFEDYDWLEEIEQNNFKNLENFGNLGMHVSGKCKPRKPKNLETL